MANSKGFQSYADFRASWNQENTSLNKLMQSVEGSKSITSLGIQDIRKFENPIYAPEAYRTIEAAMWKAVQAAGGRKMSNKAPQGVKAGLELISLLEDFKTKNGMLSSATSSKLETLISNVKNYTEGSWTHLDGIIRTTLTLLGEIGEEAIRETLSEELVQKGIVDDVMEGMSSQLSDTNIRGEWIRETPKGWNITHHKGTPLTDIQVKLKSGGGTINISVKESFQKGDVKTLKALTTTFGALTKVVFDEAGGNDYYGYTFYRVAGRLSGQTGAVREIKAYLAQKNLAEALIGSGMDKINDFIINGKIIPAELFVKALKEEAETADRIAKIEGSLPVRPLSDTSADAAVRRYIVQKQFNDIAGAKQVLTVQIPRVFQI